MITMNPSPTMPNCHFDPHLPSTLRSLSLSLTHTHIMGKNSGLFPHTSVFLMHCWVAFLSPTASLANLADELSLLAMKAHITSDSKDVLATNWSTTASYCNWFGVSCDAARQRVIALDLSNMDLEGTIAPQVGNLSFLVTLDLSNNSFHASIPNEIGKFLDGKNTLLKNTAM